jgi:SAM-dependent methyltransferase
MDLRRAWEDNAEDWIRFARTPGHDVSFEPRILPSLLELLPPPGRLTIDLGCGEGRLTRVLRPIGHPVVAVDVSPTMIGAAAAEDPTGRYVVGDATRFPIRDGAADLVVAGMSWDDVDDVDAATVEIARVLQPGGRFCFAILHPLNSAGAFTESAADAPFVIEGSYLDERPYTYVSDRGGIRMTFHGIHRPLQSFTRSLEAAGLLIESLRESRVPEWQVAENPEKARWNRVPLFLFGRAIKSR